jgi:hypothetical protein
MARRFLLQLVMGAVGALVAVPASAQAPLPQPDRPYRGLFGGGVGDASQVLTLSLSFGGGYTTQALLGSTVAAGATPPAPGSGSGTGAPATLQNTNSAFETGSATLSYSYNLPRVGFNAMAASSGVYFPGLHQPVLTTESAGFGANLKLAAHTTLTASESVMYQPFYSFAPISQLVNPGSAGVALPVSIGDLTSNVDLGASVFDMSTVALSQGLTRRLGLSFTENYSNSLALATPDLDFSTQTQTANVTYSILRGLLAYVGYSHQDSTFGPPDARVRTASQGVIGGLTFGRAYALSLTRNTTLGFGFGATTVSDGHTSTYGLTGNAVLTRQIGRSWTASAGFYRTIAFVALFQHPVFTDTVSGSLGGLITRRLQSSSSAGWSGGSIGISQANSGFHTYFATTSLTYGLTRNIGLGTSYSYYRYFFGAGVQLPAGLASRADSQTVRVFMTFWEPLFERKGKGK